MKIQRISIVGAGIMGKGLAHDFALHGYQVYLWGRRESAELHRELSAYLDNEKQKKRLNDSEWEQIVNNITIKNLAEGADLSQSQLIIESITEDKKEKYQILQFISGYSDPKAIISSNTSTLPLCGLNQYVQNRERFLGTHFFSPVPYTNLVEVAKTDLTLETVIETVLETIVTLNKVPFLVQDTPGFVFNRIFLCTLNEAVYLLESMRDVTPEQIDRIFSMGWNMKYGPLQLIDLIGLDTIANCLANLYEYLQMDKYKPAPLLIDYVQQGRIGKKCGKGFYSYC